MVSNPPYFPDVMAGIVQRVSDNFSARPVDPFQVTFFPGIYSQVNRDLVNADSKFPLVWLVYPFTGGDGKDPSVTGDITCRLLIVMNSDNTYTQAVRDTLIFKPRLWPIYNLLLREIGRERWFLFAGSARVQHNWTLRPYWGGGDVNGQDSDNLFKTKVDAVDVTKLVIRLRNQNCSSQPYTPLELPAD